MRLRTQHLADDGTADCLRGAELLGPEPDAVLNHPGFGAHVLDWEGGAMPMRYDAQTRAKATVVCASLWLDRTYSPAVALLERTVVSIARSQVGGDEHGYVMTHVEQVATRQFSEDLRHENTGE